MTALLVAALLVAASSGAQTPEEIWQQKRSDGVRRELERREEAIDAEVRDGPSPDWAGSYYHGDGLGVNVHVAIAPKSGFVFVWSGCLGVYDLNYGSIDVRFGRLVMNPLLPAAGRGSPDFLPAVLVPVRWGERRYLVGAEGFDEFANLVNGGVDSCAGRCRGFLARRGDEQRRIYGIPVLPQEHAHLLLAEPISATLTKWLGSTIESTRATDLTWRVSKVEIDAGRDHGVWEGMDFHSDGGDVFTVVQTNMRTSVAVIQDYSLDSGPPQVGTVLSTRSRLH